MLAYGIVVLDIFIVHNGPLGCCSFGRNDQIVINIRINVNNSLMVKDKIDHYQYNEANCLSCKTLI